MTLGDRLQPSSRRGGEDLASLGHELRTPINQILGYTKLLEDDLREGVSAPQIQDLERIRSAARKLLAITEALEAPPESMLPASIRMSKHPSGLFRFDLPEPAPPAVTADRDPAEDGPGALLVVDDNAMNRDILSRCLRRCGYEVAVAEDGARALAAVGERWFDAILLDVTMPG